MAQKAPFHMYTLARAGQVVLDIRAPYWTVPVKDYFMNTYRFATGRGPVTEAAWTCTDDRLTAIAPFYGAAPKPREAIRRLCPVVGSWPGKDFTTKAAGVLETELTAAGVPHDLKVYTGAKHSFFNDRWRAYEPDAAADSWQRVRAFFAEHVQRCSPSSG